MFLISDSSSWWLGDWLVYGQEKFPDRYRQAMKATGLDYKTLRNYAWITRRYPSESRRAELSFQHHAEVASLPPAERGAWLDRAERENWSRNTLRKQVRAAPAGGADTAQERGEIRLRVLTSPERETAWASAAERAGRELSDWIILTLDHAADLMAGG
ncbi:LmbU family transcriptional regulator [Streptomyces sp. NPDC086549]|uniref:LmbU family transcriptional regulator n=1 Tax=Streptomyces sp. NPDC086549 TaxID=3365752 RepID=UPI0037FF8D59